MSYNSKYKGSEVEELLDSIGNKVDKVDGKQLSTEDFTTLLKQKLDSLSNYDDTEIQEVVSKLRTDLDALVSGDTTTAIKTFNEVIAFLDGISDTEDLASIIASIEQQIATKQDTIADLATIREGAALGATALQEHQDVSHLATKTEVGQKQDKLVSGVNIKTVNGMSILGEGNIEISGGATQYTAEINLITPNFNAVLEGSTGNYIEFTFDTLNENGNTLGEGVTCTYIIVRGSTKKTITERYRYKSQVKFNVDKYLKEGSNDITIGIVGNISGASASLGLTFQVVNISMSTTYDVSKVYDVRTDSKIEIPYSVSGTGTKTVEWYVDGVKKDFEVTDEIVEVIASRTKYINLDGLTQGVHGVQARAYTTINGEMFYSDSIYVDIMVYDGTASLPMTGVGISIPSSCGIVYPLQLHGVEQYVPYTFNLGMYNPTGAARTDVSVYVGGDLQSTIYMSNDTQTEYTFTSLTYGSKTLKIVAGGATREIPMTIDKSSANITEITSNLVLNLSATGRTNNDSNKEEWVFGDFHTTFNGFEWSALSGWNNNRLYISGGSDIEVNIAPFASRSVTESGFTMEMEFSTANIENDNAVLCDLRNESGKGLLITASEASLVSSGNAKVSTKYKSGENIRITYVVNPVSGTTYKGLVFIYVNGIISGAVNYASDDNFLSDAILKIGGTIEAEIRLKQIRIYSSALSGDEILNNYILYRDSVSEMMEVYNRNNILDGRSIDLDALASQCPVLMITGDIPTLEATTDKDTTIYVDVDYVNMQDPTRSFTGTHLMMKPQGTSSMGYPKKNYRLYTNKHDDSKLFDADGNQIADRLYSFKDGAQPVDCWCFKADYAESSGTHNTGIAKLWNGVMYGAQVDEEHKLRTEAQNIANENDYPYDVRTTIDGFPCHLVYRSDDSMDWVYIGKYNFNNDKSTESVFGFTGIPNFDNSKMQCWEVLNNGHHLALFQDMNNFDTEWKDAFESRYPDTKNPDVSDLKAFATWITTTSDFATEKWQHLDVYKVAAYYVYAMRFGAVDQMVKNSMFTSEDGQKFYFINYDNDTINGLRNDGYLMYPPTITRQSLDESYTTDVYAYAGHDSRLWNYLEADTEFMSIVQTIDASLYNAGLTYANAIRMFDDEQSAKWCERVYNRDAEYKYISPYVESGTNNLFMLQGSRQSHRKWWLSKRFSFIDSLFVSGEYKSNVVEVKLANAPIGVSFDITAGQQGNYGYGVNNVPISYGIPLEKNENKTFTTVQVLNVGDPLRIYAAPSLLDVNLGDFIEYVSTLNITGVYTESLGTKLKSLNLGVDSTTSTKRNTSLKVISGLASAKSLETLNIEGYQGITSLDFIELKKLKTLNAFASGLTSVSLFDGSPIELLELPSTIQSISLVNANRIPSSGLIVEDSWKSVTTINIRNCQGLCSDFNLVNTWFTNKTTVNSKCSLTMEGIAWTDVNPLDLISLAALKTDGGVFSLKGTTRLESITLEQIDQIKSLYGDNVFTKGSELFVSAPDTAFILGAKGIIEGDSLQLSSVVVSEYQGSVTWSIASGSGASISQSGLLTTTETGSARTIVVQLKHTPTQGDVITATANISVVKSVRPTLSSVSGSDRISTDSEYALSVSPSGINRDYSVEWLLSGSAFTNGHVAIKSSDKDSCIVKMVNAKGYGDLKVTATVTTDKGTKIAASKDVLVGTTLTVNIASNQGTDATIAAIKAEVKFGSTTLQVASGTTVNVPVGESVSVTYPKVDGYTQPSVYAYTSTTSSATASATYSTTIVSVTMSDNQTSLNDISGVKATVKYDSVSTQVAAGGIVKVPTGKSVTITWGAVSGYSTPATQTFTATGTSMQYEGVYKTTILSLTVKTNQSSHTDVASQNITVKSTTVNTTIKSGGSVKIPFGEAVTLTAPAVNGYATPSAVNYTAADVSKAVIITYNTTIVKVVMADNQTAYNDISGTTATVAASGMTTATVSSNGTAKVPTGASCTITWSAVTGYKTPDKQTFTTSGTSVTKTGTYQTEIVTVNVTSDIAMPSSYTITVSGIGSQTTASKVYKVPFGTSYTVSATAADGYKTPDAQTFTASQVSRAVSVVYLEYVTPPGVYIQHVNGALYTESEWTAGGYANSDANGVAILGETEPAFVIAKQDASSSTILWGGYGKAVPDIVTSTSTSTAILDYYGAGNTPKIIEYLAGTNDGFVDGAPAAEACAAFTFPNGKKGYLPALGEWKTAYNNKTAVESTMTLIGGAAIQTKYYWSSTQSDSKSSWALNWKNGNLYNYNKHFSHYVRAFAAL